MTLPHVRPARKEDVDRIGELAFALWPDASAAEHRGHADAIVQGCAPSTLPLALFVAEVDGHVVGFLEVGMRSHADGCDPRRAVGFIEGWCVEEKHRRRSVGRALVRAAEASCRARGARELASDTWVDEERSIRAHQGLGFEVVDRCVHFRKSLD
jgi:aminoglycoside 6'-N-acetyltransferase I